MEIPRNKLRDFKNEIEKIRPHSKISTVKKAKLHLDESVPLIGATYFWQDTINGPFKGRGIKISIIDTGIDCTHQDLDQGKVVAWKDFVNQRTTCYDDNGHGTHVASTAAGTGEASSSKFTGVAPEASLFGAKVCDSGGSCDGDDIIAAIEWSLDPNGDGNLNDRAHIISISLGCGPYCRDSPWESTVKWAINNGVVVVVAAGNEGELGGYGTISTPGVVEEAITVGAMYKKNYDQTFDWGYPGVIDCVDINPRIYSAPCWSSKGPVEPEYNVKPDIMAPGVFICAARGSGTSMGTQDCGNDFYTRASGTSMATPHVSGLIALALQEYPNLSPAEIKSAIVKTGYVLGDPWVDHFTYGAGPIFLSGRASYYNLYTEPQILSINSTEDSFTARVRFTNNAGIKYGIDFYPRSFGGDIVFIVPTPSEFCLNPGQSATVTIDAQNIDSIGLHYTNLAYRLVRMPNTAQCDLSNYDPRNIDQITIIPVSFIRDGTIEIDRRYLPNFISSSETKTVEASLYKDRFYFLNKYKFGERFGDLNSGDVTIKTWRTIQDILVKVIARDETSKRAEVRHYVRSIDLTNYANQGILIFNLPTIPLTYQPINYGEEIGSLSNDRSALDLHSEHWWCYIWCWRQYDNRLNLEESFGEGWNVNLKVHYSGSKEYIFTRTNLLGKSINNKEKALAIIPASWITPLDVPLDNIFIRQFNVIFADALKNYKNHSLFFLPSKYTDRTGDSVWFPILYFSGVAEPYYDEIRGVPYKYVIYGDHDAIKNVYKFEYSSDLNSYFDIYTEIVNEGGDITNIDENGNMWAYLPSLVPTVISDTSQSFFYARLTDLEGKTNYIYNCNRMINYRVYTDSQTLASGECTDSLVVDNLGSIGTFYIDWYADLDSYETLNINRWRVTWNGQRWVPDPLPFRIIPRIPNQVGYKFYLDFAVSGRRVSWMGYRIDGGPITTIRSPPEFKGLPVGRRTFTIYARDTSGNQISTDVSVCIFYGDVDKDGDIDLDDVIGVYNHQFTGNLQYDVDDDGDVDLDDLIMTYVNQFLRC